MQRALLIATSFLFLAYVPVAAVAQQKSTHQVSYVGVGTLSCGTFIEDKEARNQVQLALYVQWTWGFMSAYTFRPFFVPKWQGPPKSGNAVELPDSATVLLYIEKHCRDRPLDKVIDATASLLQSSGGDFIWKQRAP